MSLVGGFPGIAQQRRTVPAPRNPMDKSTVVSIFPKKIDEHKITIQPGRFTMAAGSPDKPSFLVVGSSSWWKEIDDTQPLLEIPNSSIQVADSIVKDYCNGLLACDMRDVMPGIFWVPGDYPDRESFLSGNGVVKIKAENAAYLQKAINKQRNYWEALVKLADGLWARTNGSPLVIGDDMRTAAKELGLQNKDWMQDFSTMEQTRCTACGSFRNPAYPVCPTCKAVVDTEKATLLNLKFAQ